MKLQSPWIVAITIAVVIAMSAVGGNRSLTGGNVIYVDDSIGSVAWYKDTPPPDRWVGIVLDEAGWERLPGELGVPFDLVGNPKAPAFADEVAVVAYMGAMPTGGHAIYVREVSFTPDRQGAGQRGRLTVRIAVGSPAPGTIVTQAFTYPLGIAKVATKSWPQGALEGLANGSIEAIVVDQNGRDWGPLHVVGGAE